MRVASMTYEATNNSEREVFLTAALSNDERGYFAEGVGRAPNGAHPNRHSRVTN